MLRRIAPLLALTTLLAAPAVTQVPLLDIRIGAHAAMPMGDLADIFTAGFGAYGRIGIPAGPVKLMASATWTRLRGKSVTLPVIGTVGLPDQDVISIQAGPHFSPAPLFDIGLEAGYFTNMDKFGLAPNVSLGLIKFDLTASYNMVFTDPSSSWINLGVGLRY